VATLEELENDVWPDPAPNEATSLVRKCHRLRKKDIAELETEDLRLLVGQGIGVAHLGPLVFALLERDPETHGDFYPGDLLSALIRSSNWPAIEPWSARLEAICLEALKRLPVDPPDIEINGENVPSLSRERASQLNAYLHRRSHTH
jgi:hypothetical protein